MRRASPNRSRPGLHAEPLDVTIGRLLAPYRLGVSAMVIEAATQQAHKKKLLALRYDIVHHAYAKLVKNDTKGTLYSSHPKFEFVEIAIDRKKLRPLAIFIAIKR